MNREVAELFWGYTIDKEGNVYNSRGHKMAWKDNGTGTSHSVRLQHKGQQCVATIGKLMYYGWKNIDLIGDSNARVYRVVRNGPYTIENLMSNYDEKV